MKWGKAPSVWSRRLRSHWSCGPHAWSRTLCRGENDIRGETGSAAESRATNTDPWWYSQINYLLIIIKMHLAIFIVNQNGSLVYNKVSGQISNIDRSYQVEWSLRRMIRSVWHQLSTRCMLSLIRSLLIAKKPSSIIVSSLEPSWKV